MFVLIKSFVLDHFLFDLSHTQYTRHFYTGQCVCALGVKMFGSSDMAEFLTNKQENHLLEGEHFTAVLSQNRKSHCR